MDMGHVPIVIGPEPDDCYRDAHRQAYGQNLRVLNPEVNDLLDFQFEDFELQGYQSHDHIKAAVAVWVDGCNY